MSRENPAQGDKRKASVRSRRRRKKPPVRPGISPGTLTVDPNAPKPVMRIFGFGPNSAPEDFLETEVQDPGQIPEIMSRWPIVWLNVDGLGDVKVINRLGEIFGLHLLALEDVLDLEHRPKVEVYDNRLFAVFRLNSLQPELTSEQVSFFVGERFVISFQERPGDSFDGVRQRLRLGKGRIRNSAGYLAYALLDSIIDHNYPILEHYGELLEELEDEALGRPDKSTITRIHAVKRDLIAIRRAVWPLRELVGFMMREETPFFSSDMAPYLRDCYDHVIQVIDLTENYREMASGLVDVYLSSLSNRMNEVMRVLTLIATIFIPLGFIAGLYGMNFNTEASAWNMPELSWRFGYPFALCLMAGVSLGLIFYFRRKGWIGASKKNKKTE